MVPAAKGIAAAIIKHSSSGSAVKQPQTDRDFESASQNTLRQSITIANMAATRRAATNPNWKTVIHTDMAPSFTKITASAENIRNAQNMTTSFSNASEGSLLHCNDRWCRFKDIF
jgi:hypothetical protein